MEIAVDIWWRPAELHYECYKLEFKQSATPLLKYQVRQYNKEECGVTKAQKKAFLPG